MIAHRTLYKRDSSGRIRVWSVEQDGHLYRFVTGLQDGKLTRSEWTTAVPKSKPSAQAQADFEVQAAYEHQLARDYFETVEETATPRFLEPMLAATYKTWPGPGYAQPKLDGIRSIVRSTGAWSRQGQPQPAVRHIVEALLALTDEGHIFDGELYNHELKADFEKISSLCRQTTDITEEEFAEIAAKVEYHVYDLPSHPGTFAERSAALAKLAETFPPCIKLVPTALVHNEAAFDTVTSAWLDDEYEGSMYRADEPYQIGKRSKALQKRKVFEDAEFPVVRIEEGTGNWAGYAKKVICQLPDGREFGAGIKGNKAFAKRLLSEKHAEVTLRFKGRTGYGIPRHAVATKWHGEGRTQ